MRHLPAVALILALTLLTVALAGPTAEARVPRNRATVVLAIDVSLSMQATDVEPTRLAAAQAAAKSFADQLTPGVNLGLVSFAGTATVLVSPTTDRAVGQAGRRRAAPVGVHRDRRGDLRGDVVGGDVLAVRVRARRTARRRRGSC